MERDKNRVGYCTLVIAASGWIIIGAAITYLELKRNAEINPLAARVNFLLKEVEELKIEIENMRNSTNLRIDQLEKKSYEAAPQYDDGFEGEYDDEYDEDVAEEETAVTKGGTGAGGSTGKRRRRSSSASYKQADAGKDDARGKRNVFGTNPIIANSPNAIMKQTWTKPGNRTKGIEAEIVLESVLPLEPPAPEVYRHAPGASSCCDTIAAHFEGDMSTASNTKTTHYQGNHRVYQSGVIGEWEPAEWMRDFDMSSKFYLDPSRNGVSIKEESQGLYYVYAQVFYSDQHDTVGFGIYVNHENVFQCTVTSLHQAETHRHKTKSNSCYTGGLIRLTSGDKVTLREIEGTRSTVMHAPKSFLGMYRVQA